LPTARTGQSVSTTGNTQPLQPHDEGRSPFAAVRVPVADYPPRRLSPPPHRMCHRRGLLQLVGLWRTGGLSPRVPRRPAAAAAAGCLPAPDGRTAPVGMHPPPPSRGGRLARRRHVGNCRRRHGTAAVMEATSLYRGSACGRASQRARAPILVGLGPLRHVQGRRRGVHPKRLRRASAGRVNAHHSVPAEPSVHFGPVAAWVDHRHARRLGEFVGAPAVDGWDAKWHPSAMRECTDNACRKKKTCPTGKETPAQRGKKNLYCYHVRYGTTSATVPRGTTITLKHNCNIERTIPYSLPQRNG